MTNPEQLITAMAAGDRAAAAQFVVLYGPQIRRRIRGKLNASTRRLFDSQDILSTLGRRLDGYVRRGYFNGTDQAELWALVMRIAERSMVEKVRIVKGDRHKYAAAAGAAGSCDEGDVAGRVHEIETPATTELPMLNVLNDPIDRQIVSLHTLGEPLQSVAARFGLSEAAVGKRWQRARDRLREALQQGEHGG